MARTGNHKAVLHDYTNFIWCEHCRIIQRRRSKLEVEISSDSRFSIARSRIRFHGNNKRGLSPKLCLLLLQNVWQKSQNCYV